MSRGPLQPDLDIGDQVIDFGPNQCPRSSITQIEPLIRVDLNYPVARLFHRKRGNAPGSTSTFEAHNVADNIADIVRIKDEVRHCLVWRAQEHTKRVAGR